LILLLSTWSGKSRLGQSGNRAELLKKAQKMEKAIVRMLDTHRR